MSTTTTTTSTSGRAPRALAPGEGAARWFLANLAVVKLTGEDTEGRFSLAELVGAKGDMPPLHVHHVDDETFLVLDGEISFHADGRVLRGGPGSVFLAPRGIPHVYRVESGTARWQVISSPPAFPEFLLEASVPAEAMTLPDRPPAIGPEQVTGIAARFGIEILGPPGTLPD
jgi:quercetin dioxygenase-like cupin family protein